MNSVVDECQYFEIKSLNSHFSYKHKEFYIMNLNTRSIIHKRDNIEKFICELGMTFDVSLLSQTWLREDECVPVFETYHSVNLTRINKIGGGFSIKVKDNFSHSVINFPL